MATICHLPFTCTSSRCFESDAPTSMLLLVGLGTECCSVSSACHMISGLVTAFQGMNGFLFRMSSSLRALTDFGNLLTEMSFSKPFTFSTATWQKTGHQRAKKRTDAGLQVGFALVVFQYQQFTSQYMPLLSRAALRRAKWSCRRSRSRASGRNNSGCSTLSAHPPPRSRRRYVGGNRNKRGMSGPQTL